MKTKLTRWETPLSDAKSVQMVSLYDNSNELIIILEDVRSPNRNRTQITFKCFAGYQNILEEYRVLEKWNIVGYGWTVIATQSPWSKKLKKEPCVKINHENGKHYIIVTEDDVIDVYTSEDPIIENLGPTNPNESPAGKSTVYFHPDDKEEIDELIEEIQNSQPVHAPYRLLRRAQGDA